MPTRQRLQSTRIAAVSAQIAHSRHAVLGYDFDMDGERTAVLQNIQIGFSSCGYCGNGKAGKGKPHAYSSKTLGGWAELLSVDQYQCLLDRGWRRSGCYLYHPFNQETCCPQYTIRLNVHQFRPSKVRSRRLMPVVPTSGA